MSEMKELPEDIKSWVRQRARDIRDERQHASLLLEEQRGILKLARTYGIELAVILSEEADADKVIKRAREFKNDGDEFPFFSESNLYPLLGKDAARSVLSIVDSLIRQITG